MLLCRLVSQPNVRGTLIAMEQMQIYEAKLDLERQISGLLTVFYVQTGKLVGSIDPGYFDVTELGATNRNYVFNARVTLVDA